MSGSRRPEQRPPHLIRRDEVGAWLADSAVKELTVHRTTAGNAAAITEHGVRIEHTSSDAGWGQGFYSGTRADRQYGDATVNVAVRMRHPWVVADTLVAAEQLDRWLFRFQTDDIGKAVRAAGYDGVVVEWGPGDLWVVAFSDEQVKVVAEP